MIKEIRKGKHIEVHTGKGDFTSVTLSQPDELITYRDETVHGYELDEPTPADESRRSPKKASFLRSSLKEHRERQRNRNFYLTKPAFRATGDCLIPKLFAESFDASSAAQKRKETISLSRTVRDGKFNVIP